MELKPGQLLIILAPFMEYEIYANVKQIDNDTIMLEMKADMEVPFDKEILCMVIDEESIWEFYTQVIVKKNNLIYIKTPLKEEMSSLEKRKFNRVDCYIGFVATPISINGTPIPNSDKKFTGIIKNISGGGVMIEGNLNLPVDMVFSFKLKLNFFLDCKAKIVRTTALDKDTYQSGCQFIDNTLENVKTISLFAFKERLRQKRKELNQRKIQRGGKFAANGER